MIAYFILNLEGMQGGTSHKNMDASMCLNIEAENVGVIYAWHFVDAGFL